MQFSVQKIISDSIRKKEENRGERLQTTWHASALGSCLCGQYLARLGVKPDEAIDDRTLRVFDMGNKIEDWVVSLIKDNEFVMEDNATKRQYQIETQGRVLSEKYNFSGYYDLSLKDIRTQEKEIVELKSKHSKSFWYMDKQGQGAQDSHQMQLWSYLEFTETDKGRIVYISKDDLAVLEYPIFRNNEELRRLVLDQLEVLNEAWEQKIPPKPAPPESWQAKYCNCHSKCLQQEKYLEREPLFYKDLIKEKKLSTNKKTIKI